MSDECVGSNRKYGQYPPLAGAGCTTTESDRMGVDKKMSGIQNVQVSKLRDKAANWKQQELIRIAKVDNIKIKSITEEIASASPRN